MGISVGGVTFPLTPALSLGERERHFSVLGESRCFGAGFETDPDCDVLQLYRSVARDQKPGDWESR